MVSIIINHLFTVSKNITKNLFLQCKTLGGVMVRKGWTKQKKNFSWIHQRTKGVGPTITIHVARIRTEFCHSSSKTERQH